MVGQFWRHRNLNHKSLKLEVNQEAHSVTE